ncbi:hypothetical protein HELRODRAFT_192480 [Helobdella robusta]|uniref:TNF family profile domain-containing protein n=1 Tax=Helobdella robusta TaxID=6412 RepID=T1FU02_HELRO|nr:hypothetical protein HELRODRAFT_192480 [Helobdella robusta]ESO00923.1 hypothetical protein HELRODRAFT_192480 [Helobdella robusta]
MFKKHCYENLKCHGNNNSSSKNNNNSCNINKNIIKFFNGNRIYSKYNTDCIDSPRKRTHDDDFDDTDSQTGKNRIYPKPMKTHLYIIYTSIIISYVLVISGYIESQHRISVLEYRLRDIHHSHQHGCCKGDDLKPNFNATKYKTSEVSRLTNLNFWRIDKDILLGKGVGSRDRMMIKSYFKYHGGDDDGGGGGSSSSDTGHVWLKQNGLYIVYAQILFHDVKWRWSIGVMLENKVKAKCLETEQLKEIPNYYPDSHSVYKQCSVFTIVRARRGQRLSIRDMYGDRAIHTHPEFTFWGVIKIM